MNSAISYLISELRAYKRAHTLASAVSSGILDVIQSGNDKISKISNATGIDQRYCFDYLEILRYYKLINIDDDCYIVTEIGKAAAMNDEFRAFSVYHLKEFEAWTQLNENAKLGAVGGKFHAKEMTDGEFTTAYMNMMNLIAEKNTEYIYEKIKHLLKGNIIDVGAGPATFCRYAAKRAPINVTLVDYHEIVKKNKEMFSYPVEFTWVETDFRSYKPNKLYDCSFCSHIMEYYPDDFSTVRNMVKSDGFSIFVLFLRQENTCDPDSALYEISTGLNGVSIGHIFTIKEISDKLSKYGGRNIEILPLPGDVSYKEYLVLCEWEK